MAEKTTFKGEDDQGSSEPISPDGTVAGDVEQFIAQLSDEVRMLLLLKNELYEGSWEAMREDLSNRLDGKPYIFKLANRIKDDMDRIGELEAYESEHDVDLSDYLMPPRL
jgi:hypothetical protein